MTNLIPPNPCRVLALSVALSTILITQPLTLAKKPTTAPNINIAVISDHEVRLTWTRFERQLTLERRLPDQEIFTPIAVLDPTIRQYVDHDLPANVEIAYRLKPVGTRNLEDYGSTESIVIPMPPPSPPTLTRTGINTILIEWKHPSPWARNLAIERKIGGTYTTIANLPSDSLHYVDTHLETGGYEYYRLLYYGVRNTSPPSQPDSVLLDFPPPETMSYKIIDDHTVQLSWHNSINFPYLYQVEKKSSQGIDTIDISESDSVWIDTHVPYQTYVYYRIRGKIDGNYSAFSRPSTVYIVLSRITDLAVDPIHDLAVNLTWSHPEELATELVLERSIDDSPYSGVAHLDPRMKHYVDSLEHRGMQLRYHIVSITGGGNRIYSNEVGQQIPTLDAGMVHIAGNDSLQDFYIDACEVTVELYREFCNATNRELPEDPGFSEYLNYWNTNKQLPAVNVSWNDAVEFCNWKSLRLGLPPAYNGDGNIIDTAKGYRLPTEIMYRQALKFADISHVNFLGADDGWREICGCDSVNGEISEIWHLMGNVWEWVEDATADGANIILGGSYATPMKLAPDLPEFSYLPIWKSPSIGFRCVLTHNE